MSNYECPTCGGNGLDPEAVEAHRSTGHANLSCDCAIPECRRCDGMGRLDKEEEDDE